MTNLDKFREKVRQQFRPLANLQPPEAQSVISAALVLAIAEYKKAHVEMVKEPGHERMAEGFERQIAEAEIMLEILGP